VSNAIKASSEIDARSSNISGRWSVKTCRERGSLPLRVPLRGGHEQAVTVGLGHFLDPLQDFAEDMKNNAGLPAFVKNLSKHSARCLTK
jgi:hypothetical protein